MGVASLARSRDEMTITLPPEWERFVTQKVESGQYQTAVEVIREGLRLLRERDDLRQRQIDELRQAIAVGIEQAERGQGKPVSAQETLTQLRTDREAPTA